MEYDCESCGACCAYDESWPTLESERDFGPLGPPSELVSNGLMLSCNNRCIALEGEIGIHVSCRIYSRRPDTCRICEAGSVPCLLARRYFGFPEDSDELAKPEK